MSNWVYWGQSASNLIRMGHCAPTVMQTLLDLSDMQKEWLVKLVAGMPGGIGNTGFECGALTSPLILMGLQYGLNETDGSLPMIVERGHDLRQRFLVSHKTLQCKQIRGKDRFPKHCIRPVCLAPHMFFESAGTQKQHAIPDETKASYHRIYTYWNEQDFHCARAVLRQFEDLAADHSEVYDALSAFMGGTLFMGMTCSAFSAGVMLLGLQTGEIENSPSKVIRLLYRMTTGGDAFDEKINKFNRSMNAGHRMSKWFTDEFGSTQCRAITSCDFATREGVKTYIENGCITKCKLIARRVAEKTTETLYTLA